MVIILWVGVENEIIIIIGFNNCSVLQYMSYTNHET